MDASGTTDTSFTTPGSSGMGERQKSPVNATPGTDPDTPQASTSGMQSGAFIHHDPQPRGHARDLMKIEEAVGHLDGFSSVKRPDEANTTAGKGQELQFLRSSYEEAEFEEEDIIPDRPAEQTLRRITNDELLPPCLLYTSPSPRD